MRSRMRSVKGVRALSGGLMILIAICLVPAISAAQDAGSPADTTTTTASDPPPAPTLDPPATDPTPSSPSTGGLPDRSPGPDKSANGDQSAPAVTASSAPPSQATGRSAKAHAAATISVNMEDFFFSPASVSVHVGDLVTWHNRGKQPHTATADNGSFDTGTVPAGGSGSHMFTQPGTFTYVCTIHPNMHGTVRVLSAGGGGGGGASSSAGGSSSGSGTSEAAAVNSPSAGGDANTLPASGMAAGALALVGIALLASGFGVRFSIRRASADGRQLRLF